MLGQRGRERGVQSFRGRGARAPLPLVPTHAAFSRDTHTSLCGDFRYLVAQRRVRERL